MSLPDYDDGHPCGSTVPVPARLERFGRVGQWRVPGRRLVGLLTLCGLRSPLRGYGRLVSASEWRSTRRADPVGARSCSRPDDNACPNSARRSRPVQNRKTPQALTTDIAACRCIQASGFCLHTCCSGWRSLLHAIGQLLTAPHAQPRFSWRPRVADARRRQLRCAARNGPTFSAHSSRLQRCAAPLE